MSTFEDQRAYEAKLRGEERAARRYADTVLDLRAILTDGIKRGFGNMPYVTSVAVPGSRPVRYNDVVRHQPIAKALLSALDHHDPAKIDRAEALFMSVVSSKTPDEALDNIKAMNEFMVEHLISAVASDLAEFEND